MIETTKLSRTIQPARPYGRAVLAAPALLLALQSACAEKPNEKPKVWSGTITVIQVSESDTSRTGLAGGSQRLWEQKHRDSIITRIQVKDGAGTATVSGSGGGEDHFKFLGAACSPSGQEGWTRRKSTFTGGGPSTVTIEQVGSSYDYVVQFTTPAFTEEQELQIESLRSQGCPMGGGKRQETKTVNHPAGGFPIRATAIPLASLIAGEDPLSLDLEGRHRVPLKGWRPGGGDLVTTIDWKLSRQ